MPARKTSAESWVEAATHALAAGGPDAIRVEALATSLGVTKGGFYGEFSDRNALVQRVLDEWERTVVDDVIARVDDADDSAAAQLRHLFELARDLSSDGLAVELAIRDWARRDHTVAHRLKRVDDRRMSFLRKLFRQIEPNDDDAEARSLLAYSLFIGNALITADHDGRTRDDTLAAALRTLLG